MISDMVLGFTISLPVWHGEPWSSTFPDCDPTMPIPCAAVARLESAAESMRSYLLGLTDHIGSIKNHVVIFTKAHEGSSQLAVVGPNVMIRRSVFGYTILDRRQGYAGVIHNLAGFMCFLILRGNPRDNWHNTRVGLSGGEIKQPQQRDKLAQPSRVGSALAVCLFGVGSKKKSVFVHSPLKILLE